MKIITLASPVDASNYVAGAGTVSSVALRSINYETSRVRFSLVGEDEVVRSEVNGVEVESLDLATDEDIAAAIRATIEATIPPAP